MKRSLVLALIMTATTATACLACPNSDAQCKKKVSLLSRIFHKKAAPVEAKATGNHGDSSMEVAGTNFVID